MSIKGNFRNFFTLVIVTSFLMGISPVVFADVYINVLAVNGTEKVKDTSVQYNLPGDLSSQDILDTNGLDLEYNVNDSNYYVHGKVTLQPKASKTFRIRVRDVWKISSQQLSDIKNQINQGYEQIGKRKDPQQGEALKDQLIQKLDFIEQQSSKAESIEKRIDAFRAYSKELQRIENNALAVDYWHSDPSEIKQEKIIHFSIELENPFDTPKPYKHKNYLPAEIKPENLVEFEGFEVRFDQEKKQVFLFREEELAPKEKKKYVIGIKDIWFVPQKNIDYLRKRSDYAYGILKDSKYAATAQILYDHINAFLKDIEEAQVQKRETILEHISAFRENQKTHDRANADVESLEKLLSLEREDLDKSKVKNVLQKVEALKKVDDISKAIFNKQPEEGIVWKYVGLVLIFVGLLTFLSFIIWSIRSKKKIPSSETQTSAEAKASAEKK